MLDKLKYSKDVVDLQHSLSGEVRNMRLLRSLSIDELAKESDIPAYHLKNFEIGNVRDWSMFCQLVKFYKKKVKMEFY